MSSPNFNISKCTFIYYVDYIVPLHLKTLRTAIRLN